MVLGHSPLRCLAADGAILVHERKASSKEARNRRRSVPRGLVSFPWQPSQCLIKLSPCPPHAPPPPPSCRSNCRPPSLSFTLAPTKQPKKDSAKEGTKRLVTSCSFLTTYGTSMRPCWSPSRTTTPRGSPRNI